MNTRPPSPLSNCRRATFAVLLAASLAAVAPAASGAQKLWTGNAGDMLWSSPGNWAPIGMPLITDNVILTNDATTDFPYALGGSPDNLVDSLFISPSISSLGIMNTNQYHNTQVTNLSVLGNSTASVAATADDAEGYVFFIGSNQWQDGKDATVWASIIGNSLTVSNVSANFGVTQISS